MYLITPGPKNVEDSAKMHPKSNKPNDIFAYLTYSGMDLSSGKHMQWEFMHSDELFKCIENMFRHRANIENGTVETDKMVLKLMGLKRANGGVFVQEMTNGQRKQIHRGLYTAETKKAFTILMFRHPVALTTSKQAAESNALRPLPALISRKEAALQNLLPDAFKHLVHMVNYDGAMVPTWKIMRTESSVARLFLTGCRQLAGNKALSPEKSDELILHMLKQRASGGEYFADRVAHTIPEVFKLLRTKPGKESLGKVPMKYHSILNHHGQPIKITRKKTAMEQPATRRQSNTNG